MAKLLIVTPEGQQERELVAVNSVGRHPNNTVQLLDRIVSKEHCIVELRAGRYVLRDLGSRNKLEVDGVLADEVILNAGLKVTLGGTTLWLEEVP